MEPDKKHISIKEKSFAAGKVTLVGFGPGDPDLLTIGGKKALDEADIIYYDDLIDKTYLENFRAERIYVGKRNGKHHLEQNRINLLLLKSAQEGKNVIRLKGGDPMIFGRGGEEIDFLEEHGIEVQVIPGITTASALAATTRISLTQRKVSSSVAYVLGHGKNIQTPTADTLVYYMGAHCNQQIATQLIEEGRSPETPVLLVHNVSGANQQEFYFTLDELSKEKKEFPTPLIILVGNVVKKHVIHNRKIS